MSTTYTDRGLPPPPPEEDNDPEVEQMAQQALTNPIVQSLMKDKSFMRSSSVDKVRLWGQADKSFTTVAPEYRLRLVNKMFAVSNQSLQNRQNIAREQQAAARDNRDSILGGAADMVLGVPRMVKETYDTVKKNTATTGLAGLPDVAAGFTQNLAQGEWDARKRAFDTGQKELASPSVWDKLSGTYQTAMAFSPVMGSGQAADAMERLKSEPKRVAGEAGMQGVIGAVTEGGARALDRLMPLPPDSPIVMSASERSGNRGTQHVEAALERIIPTAGIFGRYRIAQAKSVIRIIRNNFVDGLDSTLKMSQEARGGAIKDMIDRHIRGLEDTYNPIYAELDDKGKPVMYPKSTPTGEIGEDGAPVVKVEDRFDPGDYPIDVTSLSVKGVPIETYIPRLELELKSGKFAGTLTKAEAGSIATYLQQLKDMVKASSEEGGTSLMNVRQLRDTPFAGKIAERLKPLQETLTDAMVEALKAKGAHDLVIKLQNADALKAETTGLLDRDAVNEILDPKKIELLPDLIGSLGLDDIRTIRQTMTAKAGGTSLWNNWLGDWFERELLKHAVAKEDPARLSANAGESVQRFLVELDRTGKLEELLGAKQRANVLKFSSDLNRLNLFGRDVTSLWAMTGVVSTLLGSVGGAGAAYFLGPLQAAGVAAGTIGALRIMAHAMTNPQSLAALGEMARSLRGEGNVVKPGGMGKAAQFNMATARLMKSWLPSDATPIEMQPKWIQQIKKMLRNTSKPLKEQLSKDKNAGVPTP